MKYSKILMFVLLSGVILRLVFLSVGLGHIPIGSDEAMLGLMAKRIWFGEFPLITWVQPHGGTLEAYLNALPYLLFRTGKLTVRLLPFLCSILFMVLMYLIGKEYFGKRAGLITLSLVAIPPAYLCMMGTLGISMNVPALLGSATVIYIARRVDCGNLSVRHKLFLLIVMGFVTGLTFWVHLIVVCAILAALFFFFAGDKLFFLRRDFLIFIIFFLIGSSPLWVYNFSHEFATLRMTQANSIEETIRNLKTCLMFTLPATWGLYLPPYIDSSYMLKMRREFSIPYAVICVVLVFIAIAIRRKSLRRIFLPRISHPDGIWALLFFFLVNIAVFSRNSRTNAYSTRYLAPTFIALIPILGFALAEVMKRSKVIFGLLLGFLISFNLAGNIAVMRAWAQPGFPEKHLCLPENEKLISFLERENIHHGYMHYWLSYPIVFKTDEKIKISPAYDERFGRYTHPYLEEVRSVNRIAYVFHPSVGLNANWFEKGMKRIGGEYRKRGVSSFTVFYDFKAPVGNLKPVDKDGFTLFSNYGRSSLHFAVDSDHTTRWGTASPQRPGMSFTVDMGMPREICGALLYLDDFQHDFPRGLEVYVSDDGDGWEMVHNNPEVGGNLYWDGSAPRIYTNEDYVRIVFEPVNARWVRLVQTGYDRRLDWSITEFEVLQGK